MKWFNMLLLEPALRSFNILIYAPEYYIFAAPEKAGPLAQLVRASDS